MPTKDRRLFIRAAIDCWLRQDYPNKELVIVDDGALPIANLVPHDNRIKYFIEPHPPKRSTGRKRNYCNELAAGEIICHFDDDDWSHPSRISHQVDLLRKSEKPITGFGTLLFWDTIKLHARRYKALSRGYVCGTTLCYLKDFWRDHQFPDLQEASDNGFVYPNIKCILAGHQTDLMVARIHRSHTSSKNGIRQIIPDNLLPQGFRDNEKLRLSWNED
jgi:glycosyltransferase involved in cell wall biosynthesis